MNTRIPKRAAIWLWAAIPLLAFLAYGSVVWLGFLSDDLVLLQEAKISGINVHSLLPDTNWLFYRPVGIITTWEAGWQLWGFNPLPYHLLGLLLHALASLLLGLWLNAATGRLLLAWLSGAIFAVFPLNSEAVGWVASQWDLWAMMFGLLSIYAFTKWWKERVGSSWPWYVLSLLAFLLGVFSKESLLSFLPLIPISIWLLQGLHGWPRWRTLILALIPFGGVLALNLGIRVVFQAQFGYQNTRTDFWNFYWDSFMVFIGMLAAPVNGVFIGKIPEQIIGSLTALGLLAGLIAYGRQQWRPLLMGAAWLLLALIPVLNLAANNGDLTNSRLLYFGSAGYAIIIGTLLCSAVSGLHARQRTLATYGIALLLSTAIFLSWLNLQPWHIASGQVEDINNELGILIPPEPRPLGIVWYTQNLPDNFDGAVSFRSGLGNIRFLTSPAAENPEIIQVDPRANPSTAIDLNKDGRDAFAMRFASSPSHEDYYVDYMAGRTNGVSPPVATRGSSALQVWDFTTCQSDLIAGWELHQADVTSCVRGTGLALKPQNSDPQLISPPLNLGNAIKNASFLRIRVAIRFPADMPGDPFVSEWFWGTDSNHLSEEHRISRIIAHTPDAQVYWSFIPVSALSADPMILRFDPINSALPETILWIAVDLVQ